MAFCWQYWRLPPIPFAATMIVAGALWAPLLFLHSAFTISLFGAYSVTACPFLRRALFSVTGLTVLCWRWIWPAPVICHSGTCSRLCSPEPLCW